MRAIRGQADARGRKRQRRQWGSDGRSPLPAVPSARTERLLSATRIAIFVTLVGWVAFVATTLSKAFFGDTFSVRYAADAIVYLVVVTLLTGSALAYLVARLGFAHRARKHERVPRSTIDSFFSAQSPELTVIVPSYREDASVIRQTLLSAALQEYPAMNVVLLIDDPPNPDDPHDLAAARVGARAAGPRSTTCSRRRASGSSARSSSSRTASSRAARSRSRACGRSRPTTSRRARSSPAIAADFDEDDAAREVRAERGDRRPRERPDDGRRVRCSARRTRAPRCTPARMVQLYRRLVWTFRAELSSFERKRYAVALARGQQGDEPQQLHRPDGRQLPSSARRRPARCCCRRRGGQADLVVPDPDYVLTLDADSVLLPEYCLRLVYLMEQPEYARRRRRRRRRTARSPAPPTRIERIAGATTDLQHIVHQGMTLLRRHLLGRRQRRPAQARARRHRRDRAHRRLPDPPLHPGPHRHRGHRVEHRPRHPRLDAATTTPSG